MDFYGALSNVFNTIQKAKVSLSVVSCQDAVCFMFQADIFGNMFRISEN